VFVFVCVCVCVVEEMIAEEIAVQKKLWERISDSFACANINTSLP